MELYPFQPPDLPQAVEHGWAQAVTRGPSTITEVLERGRLAGEAEDELEELARDPIAYYRLHRPRTRLLDVLLYGRARP